MSTREVREKFDIENFLHSFIDVNISPARVVFKNGVLAEVPEFLSQIGDRFAVITRPELFEIYSRHSRFPAPGADGEVFHCAAICSRAEAERLYDVIGAGGAFDGVVAVGGGTVMDIAKLVAYNMRKPLVTIPTSPATCASFTALSVVYDDSGVFKKYDYLSKNPDMCLVDPVVLMTAGARLLAAGMADTMAKYIEGVWSYDGKITDYYSDLGLNIAFKIYNEILSIGPKALADCREGTLSRELFEAFSYNIIASGLSSGISGMKIYPNIAHSVANGLTRIVNGRDFLKLYHGEGVAFGMSVGMTLMEPGQPKAAAFLDSLRSMGLPVSFGEVLRLAFGRDFSAAEKEPLARSVVEAAMLPVESIHDIALVTPELLFKSIMRSGE